jgi:NADH-quinone oxidoreductase subunit E
VARLSPENEQRARDLISLYPEARSALIPMLHVAQEQDGWLTPDAIGHVAELLDLTAAEVLGTASFYDMLFTHPVGKYLVSVCTNIACLLNGGYELLEHAEDRLGVRAGSTTADGAFTLEEVECIALCGNAPCLTVNWRFFGDVTDQKFDQLLEDLRADRLSAEIPPHGTLSRVRRTVGMPAKEPVAAGGGPGGAAAPSSSTGGAEGGGYPETQPAAQGSVDESSRQATQVESGDTSSGGTGAGGATPEQGNRP